ALPARPGLAIVGARRASTRGRAVALRLARAAAGAGVAVVSGLAYGIDAAAHQGALEGGGPTLAVLASGLDRPSPRANAGLARRLLDAGGAWLSEYRPGTPPAAFRFPERNRLISALSRDVLVVEAGERSGSLWTVRHALDQGRDVLAVPGPVDSASCLGSNRLLRDGAGVILDERDLLDRVAPETGPTGPALRARPSVSGDAARVWAALADGPAEVDALADRLGLQPGPLASALLDLELSGLASRHGSRVLRAG
ncbi:MAG: DNA-protecting protein DprA, partial [Deltaproteobacteria bacterium]|nr:DNA-protecting protein DprA [Deltaproteobacteria bacterium]